MLGVGKTFVRAMSSLVCREVTVPVPWGVIAGKQWTSAAAEAEENTAGSAPGTQWLALHGWLDNAGSFDTLAPQLVAACPRHALLCLDYPGHGRSSHLPPGQMYHYLEALRYIRLVARHQGYEKFGLLGHSMGAGMCSLFAAVYPEMVEALVMIDLVKPIGRKMEDVVEKTRMSIESALKIQDKIATTPDKVFPSEAEALKRLQEAARNDQGEGSVTEESARIMLRRGIRPVEGGVSFSRDLRHRGYSLYGLVDGMCEEFARNIQCPHLLIKASESPNYEDEESVQQVLDIYRTNPRFSLVGVEGSHHVHLNNPERVAPHIHQFISEHLE